MSSCERPVMDIEERHQLLEDVQLTLENDARFYRWCNLKSKEYYGNTNLSAATPGHWKNTLRYYYGPAASLAPDQVVYLRRYFQWRYGEQNIPPPEVPGPADITATVVLDPVITLNPPQEKPVSTKLTFKPQYLLNNLDVSKLTKTEIYEMIAAEEKRITKLREIQHQPKSLIEEIEQAEATLTALVEYLDNV